MPQAISIKEAKDAPWGSIKAAQFQPDGATFDTPALLTFKISDGDLPHGVKKESLRVAALEGGAWKILGGSRFDPEAGAVSAPINHFSIYGLVAEPGAISGKGTRFELNGITAQTRDSVNGRLFVAPSFVSFYAEADEAGTTSLTLSGLPADGVHHVYAGSHDNHHVLTPADGGTVELPLDLAGPSLVWIQPQPSTIVIGGGPDVDECASYGERTGEVCTLTADVVGDIELRGGALDCGGHSITQHAAYGGSGIGVFVPLDTYGAVIENCMIGSSAGNFAYGMEILGADTAVVSGNILEGNIIGVLLQGTSNSFVSENQFIGASLWAVALWGSSLGNEVSGNAIDVDNDAMTIEGLAGAPSSSSGNRVLDNMVTRATGGILLVRTRENTIRGNDISGVLTALLIGAGGWPSTVYWNDFHGWSRWGVWSDVGPADVSDRAGHGNWWGHSCPGPLFTPGIDSNRVDVVDSYPYGEANAWRTGIPPGCGPSAPVFLLPTKGEVTTERSPAIIGIALPYAMVNIYEGFSMIGEGIAQENSLFEIFPDLRMEEGEHTLHATATDEMGISSPPSEPRTFSIVASPREAPLYGTKGKMRVMDLQDDPDPMNPISDISFVEASIRVDGVKGLAGKSKNHVFLATVEREILSPVDGSRVQVVKGSAPLVAVEGEEPPSFVSLVAAGWDGKGADGRPVMENLTYPYNVVLKVIRLYTGKGKGPGCSRDETSMEDEAGKEACLIDAIELPRAGSTSILPVTTWNYDPELIPYDLDMPLSVDSWSMLFEEYRLFRLPARLVAYFRWGSQDTDGDTLINMNDNCPGDPNPLQENADGDRRGDICDACPGNEMEVYGYLQAICGLPPLPRDHEFEFVDMHGCGCDDEDGGRVPYRYGRIYIEHPNEPAMGNGTCRWRYNTNYSTAVDACSSSPELTEFYCNALGLQRELMECPYGCQWMNAKCLCEEAETDGGDNRWIGGSIGIGYSDECDGGDVIEYVARTSADGRQCDVVPERRSCPPGYPCDPSIDACKCGDGDRDNFIKDYSYGENLWAQGDQCADEFNLIEYHAEVPADGIGCEVTSETVECGLGCMAGKCRHMERRMYFSAHQDNDLLFMNPYISEAIRSGDEVNTVYITAGDDCCSKQPGVRENGVKAAYAWMDTGVADYSDSAWSCEDETWEGKNVTQCTLLSNPHVMLVFLRIQDCRCRLYHLWAGDDPNITTIPIVDPYFTNGCQSPQTYTRWDLLNVLSELIEEYNPTQIVTHYFNDIKYIPCIIDDSNVYGEDHGDHTGAGKFAWAAHQNYQQPHDYMFFRGYNIEYEDENLTYNEHIEKMDIFNEYCKIAESGCPTHDSDGGAFWYHIWRQYGSTSLHGIDGQITGIGEKCLSAESLGGDILANIQTCDVVPEQKWEFTNDGKIVGLSGSCLTVRNDSTENGTELVLRACTDSPGQRWNLLTNGQIIGIDGKCLDVEGAGTADGTPVQIWDCVGQADISEVQRSPVPQQVWSLRYGLVTGRSFGSEFSDSDLGSGESYYGSFRLGDVNGDGYMDACARFASGFKCARNNGDGTFASYAGGPSTGEFSDGLGWDAPDHGTTIQLGDLNNDGMADVCGRGDAGIYCVLSTGDSFQGSSLWTTSFSNESNGGVWDDSESYYRSIDLGDIDGDGFADVCGRAADGVWCALNTRYPQGFNDATLWINEFTNGQGWILPEYGTTMQLGDVNGDGKADLCGRGSAGVYCAVSSGSAFVNPRVWTYRDNFSDWKGWHGRASYYLSLRLGDVNGDGKADVCGRGVAGIWCAISIGLHFDVAHLVLPHYFTNDSVWQYDRYGTTIQLGDLNRDGHADVCGVGEDELLCGEAP